MQTSELLARLEAATGADRELNKLLAPLVGLRLVEEGHPLGSCCYDKNGHGVPLPSFTASIDAALTLVPEGWFFDIRIRPQSLIDQHAPFLKMGEVSFTHPDGEAGIWRRVQAATPALAICIAALRARHD